MYSVLRFIKFNSRYLLIYLSINEDNVKYYSTGAYFFFHSKTSLFPYIDS